MRKYLLTIIAIISIDITSFAQAPDLSGIKDRQSLKQFYNDKKAEEVDAYRSGWQYVSFDNAVWNGIQVKDISVYADHIEMSADETIPNTTQKLLTYIENKYKNAVIKDQDYSSAGYLVNNSDIRLSLNVRVYEDDTLKPDSRSTLTIWYKKQYTQPFPNIGRDAIPDHNGIFYYLDFSSFNVNTEILLNGISIYNHRGRHRYMNEETPLLNRFILGRDMTHLKILITPGYDEDGNQIPVIRKDAYFKARLCEGKLNHGQLECTKEYPFCDFMEYVTDTTIEEGDPHYYIYPGTSHYGGKQLECSLDFLPDVSYSVAGWKQGEDLRKKPDLKQKITNLYEQLATAIKNKDEKMLNDLLYQQEEESIKTTYNIYYPPPSDKWERWMQMLDYAYVIKVAKDFDLEFSEDGKLVYTYPKDQVDMLRAIGKQQAEGFTFFLYEDKNDHELKFVR